MEKKVLLSVGLGFGLLLAGCSGTVAEPEKVGEEPSKEVSADAPEKKEESVKDQVFNVGDNVKLGDNVVAVTQVEKSAGADYDTPKEGMEYVIVHVKINNGGEENIAYNPYDFQLKNSKGQITDITFTTIDTDTALNSGELAAGGEVTGTLAFEAPKDDAGLQLIYQPNFWMDSETVTVNLQ